WALCQVLAASPSGTPTEARGDDDQALITSSGLFNADWYGAQCADVPVGQTARLEHFVQHGVREARNPNPLFDSQWDLSQYPDHANGGLPPFLHYLRFGAADGRLPCQDVAEMSLADIEMTMLRVPRSLRNERVAIIVAGDSLAPDRQLPAVVSLL